jgi:hypothetical protein
MRTVRAIRYLTPLKEGGSLPAIVETDDGTLQVVKFRGAGQGVKALVAEVVAGEVTRALGLQVPELVLVDLDPAFGRTEGDPEIRHLLGASAGINLGLAYLDGALPFDPAARVPIDGALASRAVAADAFTMNVDRTARNPNMLWWKGGLWLIDHGAALYWHHDWDGGVEGRIRPFPAVRDHVLLRWADGLPALAAELPRRLTDDLLAGILAGLPDDWLEGGPDRRAGYLGQLRARRDGAAVFIEEAVRARGSVVV